MIRQCTGIRQLSRVPSSIASHVRALNILSTARKTRVVAVAMIPMKPCLINANSETLFSKRQCFSTTGHLRYPATSAMSDSPDFYMFDAIMTEDMRTLHAVPVARQIATLVDDDTICNISHDGTHPRVVFNMAWHGTGDDNGSSVGKIIRGDPEKFVRVVMQQILRSGEITVHSDGEVLGRMEKNGKKTVVYILRDERAFSVLLLLVNGKLKNLEQIEAINGILKDHPEVLEEVVRVVVEAGKRYKIFEDLKARMRLAAMLSGISLLGILGFRYFGGDRIR